MVVPLVLRSLTSGHVGRWKCHADRCLFCDYWWVDEELEKWDFRLIERNLKYLDVVHFVVGR